MCGLDRRGPDEPCFLLPRLGVGWDLSFLASPLDTGTRPKLEHCLFFASSVPLRYITSGSADFGKPFTHTKSRCPSFDWTHIKLHEFCHGPLSLLKQLSITHIKKAYHRSTNNQYGPLIPIHTKMSSAAMCSALLGQHSCYYVSRAELVVSRASAGMALSMIVPLVFMFAVDLTVFAFQQVMLALWPQRLIQKARPAVAEAVFVLRSPETVRKIIKDWNAVRGRYRLLSVAWLAKADRRKH